MMNAFQKFWVNLQLREQRVILLGSGLVLATVLYLVFDTQWSKRSALMTEERALLEENQWMQEQATLAEQLVNNCRESQILALESQDLLELLASRNQLNLTNISESSNANRFTFTLQMESNSGNNILRFIHQSACQGFTLISFQIDKNAEPSIYSAQLEFSNES